MAASASPVPFAATAPLLVELFVEELPPKALKKLGQAFAQQLFDALQAQGLSGSNAAVTPFATPRRLGAHIPGGAARAAPRAQRQTLFRGAGGLAAGGQPTAALLKKLAALGLDAAAVPTLQRAPDGKAESLFVDTVLPGVALADGLQKALHQALTHLPIPKVMTYQLHQGTALPGWDSVQFVRPAHGLLALHGDAVVPVTALGLQAGRATHGHRFEAAQDPITIDHADRYASILREQGAVIASFDERRALIESQLKTAASQAGQALTAIKDEALLDEVAALVERPNVLVCQFEPEFLQVPQECLILTMKANQKYFPLLDGAGKLTHRFLVVSNISPQDPSAVIGGNERVVRPRLQDAKFFFDQDRKKTLVSRVEQLAKVVAPEANFINQRDEDIVAPWLAKHMPTSFAQYDIADKNKFANVPLGVTKKTLIREFPIDAYEGGAFVRESAVANGEFWLNDMARNRVGKMNLQTGKPVWYDVPSPGAVAPHTMSVDGEGNLWVTLLGGTGDMAAMLNPKTESWRVYGGFPKSVAAHDFAQASGYRMDADKNNIVWMTLVSHNKLIGFNRTSGEVTPMYDLPIPDMGGTPEHISVYSAGLTSDKNVWFTQNYGDVGRFNTETRKVDYLLNYHGAGPHRLVIGDNDLVYVAVLGAGQISVIDGKQLKEVKEKLNKS